MTTAKEVLCEVLPPVVSAATSTTLTFSLDDWSNSPSPPFMSALRFELEHAPSRLPDAKLQQLRPRRSTSFQSAGRDDISSGGDNSTTAASAASGNGFTRFVNSLRAASFSGGGGGVPSGSNQRKGGRVVQMGAPVTVLRDVRTMEALIENLTPDTCYTVRLRASNRVHGWSSWSKVVEVWTANEEDDVAEVPVHMWVLVPGEMADAATATGDLEGKIAVRFSRSTEEQHVFLRSCSNGQSKAFDGIDVCGARLAAEVIQEVVQVMGGSSKRRLLGLSFVAHRVGGLFVRACLPYLISELRSRVAGLTLCNFVSIAVPHIGCCLSKANTRANVAGSVSTESSRTALQLYLLDVECDAEVVDVDGGGGGGGGETEASSSTTAASVEPLLVTICGDEHVAALRQFRFRVIYANVRATSVGNPGRKWFHIPFWSSCALVCHTPNPLKALAMSAIERLYSEAYSPVLRQEDGRHGSTIAEFVAPSEGDSRPSSPDRPAPAAAAPAAVETSDVALEDFLSLGGTTATEKVSEISATEEATSEEERGAGRKIQFKAQLVKNDGTRERSASSDDEVKYTFQLNGNYDDAGRDADEVVGITKAVGDSTRVVMRSANSSRRLKWRLDLARKLEGAGFSRVHVAGKDSGDIPIQLTRLERMGRARRASREGRSRKPSWVAVESFDVDGVLRHIADHVCSFGAAPGRGGGTAEDAGEGAPRRRRSSSGALADAFRNMFSGGARRSSFSGPNKESGGGGGGGGGDTPTGDGDGDGRLGDSRDDKHAGLRTATNRFGRWSLGSAGHEDDDEEDLFL